MINWNNIVPNKELGYFANNRQFKSRTIRLRLYWRKKRNQNFSVDTDKKQWNHSEVQEYTKVRTSA